MSGLLEPNAEIVFIYPINYTGVWPPAASVLTSVASLEFSEF